jgi:lysozyme family protein
MVASTFPHALRLVLVDEGGLDDDPHDHGGRTAHGIIQREYDGYRARHSLPPQDVWHITPAEYTEIYHNRYWAPWCDRLPPGLDYEFFDACVNTGPAQATRCLQSVLGVRVDGHMGDVTLGKIAQSDPEKLIHDFCEARRNFYRHLKQFPRYGRGWLARVDHVERAARAMTVVHPSTVQRVGFTDEVKAQASARANPDDVKEAAVSTGTSVGMTTGAGLAATLLPMIASTKTELATFAGQIGGVETILFVVTVAGIALAAYSQFHKRNVARAVP